MVTNLSMSEFGLVEKLSLNTVSLWCWGDHAEQTMTASISASAFRLWRKLLEMKDRLFQNNVTTQKDSAMMLGRRWGGNTEGAMIGNFANLWLSVDTSRFMYSAYQRSVRLRMLCFFFLFFFGNRVRTSQRYHILEKRGGSLSVCKRICAQVKHGFLKRQRLTTVECRRINRSKEKLFAISV